MVSKARGDYSTRGTKPDNSLLYIVDLISQNGHEVKEMNKAAEVSATCLSNVNNEIRFARPKILEN